MPLKATNPIDSRRAEFKTDYRNNRGDAKTFAINSFFSVGRVAALSGLAADDDLTTLESFSRTLDAIASFGNLSGPLWRASEYLSRGDGAVWIAQNNRYYIAEESGGAVKLVAATTAPVIIRDPDIIAQVEADHAFRESVVFAYVDPDTLDTTDRACA